MVAAKSRSKGTPSAPKGPAKVVGIGASAGGLEPITAILRSLPPSTGMAFVIIQHLDPDHPSLLVSLLERVTEMPIARIEEGMLVEPDHVYVIPERADVTARAGAFHLLPRSGSPAVHEPFDTLLTSLAKNWGERAVAVILSGSDKDGLAGMRLLKEAGGATVAQDPATAQYPSMPQHAIDAGVVDAVLAPGDIADYLTSLAGGSAPRRTSRPVAAQAVVGSDSASMLLARAKAILEPRDERPGVIVDEDLPVLAFRGGVDRYVTIPSGPATLDLSALVPPEIAVAVRRALTSAVHRELPATAETAYSEAGTPVTLRVEAVPLDGVDAGAYLVLFGETPVAARPGAEAAPGDGPESELRREVASLRLALQSAREENDACNEELQSSMEEAQSVNEELQTAKEELQSTNEELITVNDELQERNAELNVLNNDLTSLLTSVDIPIVVLGSALEIRRFTPAASRVLNVIPGDVGRPLTDLRLKVSAASLVADLRAVVTDGTAREQQVRDEQGHWFILRLRPYRTDTNEIRGAVLSLIDIDEAKRAEEVLDGALEFLNSLFDTVREPLVVLDAEQRVLQANDSFYNFFQVGKKDTEGRKFSELGAGQWDVEALQTLLEEVLTADTVFQDFAVTYRFPQIGTKTLLLNARRVLHTHLGGESVLIAIEDAVDRATSEAQ